MNIDNITPEQLDKLEEDQVKYSNIKIKNGDAYTDITLNGKQIPIENVNVIVSFFTEKCKDVCPKEQYNKILEFEKECNTGPLSEIIERVNNYGWHIEKSNSYDKEKLYQLSIFTEDRRYVGTINSVD